MVLIHQRAPPRKGDHPQKNWRATDPSTSGHQPHNWTGRRYFLIWSVSSSSGKSGPSWSPRSQVGLPQYATVKLEVVRSWSFLLVLAFSFFLLSVSRCFSWHVSLPCSDKDSRMRKDSLGRDSVWSTHMNMVFVGFVLPLWEFPFDGLPPCCPSWLVGKMCLQPPSLLTEIALCMVASSAKGVRTHVDKPIVRICGHLPWISLRNCVSSVCFPTQSTIRLRTWIREGPTSSLTEIPPVLAPNVSVCTEVLHQPRFICEGDLRLHSTSTQSENWQ